MSAIREQIVIIVALAALSPSALAFERPEETLMSLRQDQVTASFQRMLAHAPNPVAPATPADFERDPLIDVLAVPLLRWYAADRTRTTPQASSDVPGSKCPAVAVTSPAALIR
jgi:hypothetical protein